MPRKPIVPILASVIWGLAFFPGIVMAVMSPMLSDSAGSQHSIDVVTGVILWVASFPVLCLLSIAAVWSLWAILRGRPRTLWTELLATALPLIPIGVLVWFFTANPNGLQ